MRLLLRSFVPVALALVVLVADRSAVDDRHVDAAAPAPGAGILLRAPEAAEPRGGLRQLVPAPAIRSSLGSLLESGGTRTPARRARVAVDPITFGAPVFVSDAATGAAEPSIRVDTSDANKRIWIGAPTGIGVNTGFGSVGGDFFWYSDDNGLTWNQLAGPATVVGGGDSDITTGTGDQVYVTGLTLANVTLAASCDNGQTFTTQPFSTAGTIEDRQWLDMYEDSAKPAPTAPDFLLDIGLANLTGIQQNPRVVLYQITSPSPACSPPSGGPPIDTALAGCPLVPPTSADCYQWPGNVAIDEATGDAYVTYNTNGDANGLNDKVVVARVVDGAEAPATNALPVVVAANRPDTFDSFTAVAVDNASNVYVVWTERYPALGETWSMYAYSTDDGATWSAPIKVNQVPKTTTFPWPVAGDAGKIDIVYYGTDATGPSPETVPGTSQWKVYMAQSLDATSPTPTFTEVEASPVMQQGSICTSGTGCAAGTRDLLDFFMVDIDEQGLANITYTDNLNTNPGPGADPERATFVQQNGGPTLLNPTAVKLLSFGARRVGRSTELRWRTGSEADVLGYHVYRSGPAGSTRVTQRLVRARGSARGAAYRVLDRTAPARATGYRLQEVAVDGSRSWLRAVRVRAR